MLKSYIFVFCKMLKGCPQTNLWPKLGFWSSRGEPGEGRWGWNMYLNGGNSIVNSLYVHCTDWPECSKCSKCWICTTQQMSTPPWSDGEKSVHWSRLSQVGEKYCVAGISFIHGCGCGGGQRKTDDRISWQQRQRWQEKRQSRNVTNIKPRKLIGQRQK